MGDARAGDDGAFAELVRRHQSAIRRQLRHLMKGEAAIADELAQDTFVQAWRHLPSYRGESTLTTWLHRIAHRCFLMHLRAQTSRGAPLVCAPGDDEVAEPTTNPLSKRLDVARALAALPEPERLALLYCFQLELTHDEAASALGLPLGTLKSHVARGKARLRRFLAAWAPENANHDD
ncbi:MAG: sigma-70 family RNA polymerase sigma factor [Pseudomonadota bacterium]|nr:sigma-70 family RNA polymerase sigma factor [Pseudomonadota bacterium]